MTKRQRYQNTSERKDQEKKKKIFTPKNRAGEPTAHGMYYCTVCANTLSPHAAPGTNENPLFESRHELFQHEKSVHKDENELWKCPFCESKSITRNNYIRHLAIHTLGGLESGNKAILPKSSQPLLQAVVYQNVLNERRLEPTSSQMPDTGHTKTATNNVNTKSKIANCNEKQTSAVGNSASGTDVKVEREDDRVNAEPETMTFIKEELVWDIEDHITDPMVNNENDYKTEMLESDSDQYFVQHDVNTCTTCDTTVHNGDLPSHKKLHFTNSLTDRFGCAKCPLQFREKKHIRNHIKGHILQEAAVNCFEKICEFCSLHISCSNETDQGTQLRNFVKSFIKAIYKPNMAAHLKRYGPKQKQCLKQVKYNDQVMANYQESEARKLLNEKQELLQYLFDEHLIIIHGDELDQDSYNGEAPFKCGMCFRSYYSLNKFQSHGKIHGANYDYSQQINNDGGLAKIIYPNRSDVKNGVEMVHRLKCALCSYDTFFPGILQHHFQTIHKESSPATCTICYRYIMDQNHLNSETMCYACQKMSEKHQVKIISQKCKFCNIRLPSVYYLQDHLNNQHRGMVLHQCGICNFDTSNEIEFNWHLYVHKSINNECCLCKLTFGTRKGLIKHAAVHFSKKSNTQIIARSLHYSKKITVSKNSGLKKCRHCYRNFNLSYNRLQHEAFAHPNKITEKYAPTLPLYSIQCRICNCSFSTKIDRWNHELGQHCLQKIIGRRKTQTVRTYSWTLNNGSMPRQFSAQTTQFREEFKVFQSRECAASYYQKDASCQRELVVKQKSQRHLENLIRCAKSGKPFSKNLSLMTDCEFCPMKYANRQALRVHEKNVHMDANEIWLCMFCEKTYISRHELRTHIVQKHPAEFHRKLTEFHNERFSHEMDGINDLVKQAKTNCDPLLQEYIPPKEGQYLCYECNTVYKSFGKFSVARLSSLQIMCIVHHKSRSANGTVRWFMKTHFPYFYIKYAKHNAPENEKWRFYKSCPLKGTHVTRWKSQYFKNDSLTKFSLENRSNKSSQITK